jgi:hypothetical protein
MIVLSNAGSIYRADQHLYSTPFRVDDYLKCSQMAFTRQQVAQKFGIIPSAMLMRGLCSPHERVFMCFEFSEVGDECYSDFE